MSVQGSRSDCSTVVSRRY